MKSIFNIALDCDISLPELPDTNQLIGVIKISKGSPARPTAIEPDWFHHWIDSNNHINISCAKRNNKYILRFPNEVDFVISDCGSSIQYFPKPGLAPATLRHHLLDQVMPRVLGHRGEMIIHASAVTLPNGKCIAFIGDSGQGKSTLAASFHQQGATLLTDDCLLLSQKDNEIFGMPNYYGVRLFDDSAEAIFPNKIGKAPVFENSSKNRLLLPEKGPSSGISAQHLSAFFFLTEQDETLASDEVHIEPLRGAKALISFISQTFILDVTNKELTTKQFQTTKKLFDADIGIYGLQFPRNYGVLGAMNKEINEIMI